jgi:hypothetical protein
VIFGSLLLFPADCVASDHDVTRGFVEGHLHIVSPETVELAGGSQPSVTAETYAAYPLVVLTPDNKKVIATVTADATGCFYLALPPGSYLLDVQDRVAKHVRAKPQKFTVSSKETLQINFEMDTGIR